MKQGEVFELIKGERRYQDNLHNLPNRTDNRLHTVGEYLTMLRYYANKADEAWTNNAGDWVALDVIRKMAAIAVHCMEDWGAPPRK